MSLLHLPGPGAVLLGHWAQAVLADTGVPAGLPANVVNQVAVVDGQGVVGRILHLLLGADQRVGDLVGAEDGEDDALVGQAAEGAEDAGALALTYTDETERRGNSLYCQGREDAIVNGFVILAITDHYLFTCNSL
ncbi:hypothetical protein TYRP_022464 [Tyrophagus putrescentiae]|nr:hypothetical protein TYRP_022464 [Tyrophagus putrescentiae]